MRTFTYTLKCGCGEYIEKTSPNYKNFKDDVCVECEEPIIVLNTEESNG